MSTKTTASRALSAAALATALGGCVSGEIALKLRYVDGKGIVPELTGTVSLGTPRQSGDETNAVPNPQPVAPVQGPGGVRHPGAAGRRRSQKAGPQLRLVQQASPDTGRRQVMREIAGAAALLMTGGASCFARVVSAAANDNGIGPEGGPPAAGGGRQPATSRFPIETREQFELWAHYGDPRDDSNIVRVPSPWPMTISGSTGVRRAFNVHRKVSDSLGSVLAEIERTYSANERIRLGFTSFGGDRVVRRMTGASRWSLHAWGIAIDFDPLRNAYGWTDHRAALAHPDCTPFWEIWERHGWFSLGRARNYDWMHVQAATRIY